SATIDVRVVTRDEAARVEAGLRAIAPVLPGARVQIEGGLNRPPMERSTRSGALFEQVRSLGRTLGLELGEGATGGGSDGNFPAAGGVRPLEGRGAPGEGAHSVDEHVVAAGLPERAALLAEVLLGLEPP